MKKPDHAQTPLFLELELDSQKVARASEDMDASEAKSLGGDGYAALFGSAGALSRAGKLFGGYAFSRIVDCTRDTAFRHQST